MNLNYGGMQGSLGMLFPGMVILFSAKGEMMFIDLDHINSSSQVKWSRSVVSDS